MIRVFLFLAVSLNMHAALAQDVQSDGTRIGREAVSDGHQTYRVMLEMFGRMQIVTYAHIDDHAIYGGDIVLGTHNDVQRKAIAHAVRLLADIDPAALQSPRLVELLEQLKQAVADNSGIRAAIEEGTDLWPSRRIPYMISGSIADPAARTRVLEAMAHWNSSFVIQFIPASRTEAEALRFQDAAGDGWICQAQLRFTPRKGGLIQINPICPVGSIIHEIG